MMSETHTLIVGASISGLATAACLQKKGIEYIIIEKEAQVAMPWRNHYQRLHLHTPKNLSNLPFKKFGNKIPRYPSRQQVVDYLIEYQKEFNINPSFNTEAKSIKYNGAFWITETSNGTYQSKCLVMATGSYGKPRAINFKGMDTFPGKILHSCDYKTGREFTGQKVLVVGFGNSACEIAIDLYEEGAAPFMAVRSPVNVIPRDYLGIPILNLSLIMSRLPPSFADAINAPLMNLIFGDVKKLGLKLNTYGAFEQIKKERRIPVVDIGTIKYIRDGHIKIFGNISYIQGKTVHFSDGTKSDFDTIIAAIGYEPNHAEIIDVDKSRFEDLKMNVDNQKFFGKDGLYFCGFWIGPTGAIREIALDAQKIARNISKKYKQTEAQPEKVA